ncbi:uroporphyrinogen-III C-methyltransferase [Vibrio marisflavi]|uniref:Protein HemX n=1 Tax=Vibrio marisflavi CECT 7928 TaxID=634439 RepID=A0ABM9A9K5_9VIBR|nr:uroporphyrinogen-III C-methyltransferase [Vibrio marisflavi]CAH0542117.1 Protein HemX [Vibrio marisflavi CECT 7928]CAH0542618.1 Protein HemX [Vibrio marisflavi CECT 7928]
MANNNNQKTESDKKHDTSQDNKQTTDNKTKASASVPKKSSKTGAVALILSILIGTGLSYEIYHQSTLYKNEISQLKQQIQQNQKTLDSRLESVQSQSSKDIAQVGQQTKVELDQNQKSIKSLQMAVADMKGRSPNDWLLAEADYLVKLSARKLYLEHDIFSATELLENADQRIASLNDPNLFPLRQAMANDITALKALPIIDRDGLVLRLMSLQKQVDKLPLANAILPKESEVKKPVVSSDVSDWKTNLLTSLKEFSENFITFRTRDGNVTPLLSPKQDFYLRENIIAKLDLAIRAVYDEKDGIYSTALETASDWSHSYFDQDSTSVQQFENTLKTLSQQKVQVTYPVKLQSQDILSKIISDKLSRKVTSFTAEEK